MLKTTTEGSSFVYILKRNVGFVVLLYLFLLFLDERRYRGLSMVGPIKERKRFMEESSKKNLGKFKLILGMFR